MNKIYLSTVLIFIFATTYLLSAPIKVKFIDQEQHDQQFDVEKEVLETSEILKYMMKDCAISSNEIFLAKSPEEFKLILPFLELTHVSKKKTDFHLQAELEAQFGQKKPSEIATILELANFFEVKEILDGGSNILGRLLCHYSCNDNLFLQKFQEIIKPLSPEIRQTVACEIAKNPQIKYFQDVKKWLFNQGKKTLSVDKHDKVIFSPDDRHIAIFRYPASEIKILDTKTCQCIKTFYKKAYLASNNAFSPDGKHIALVPSSNIVNVIDLDTGESIRLTGHKRRVILTTFFGPESKYIATGSQDSLIKIWNLKIGECIRTIGEDIVDSMREAKLHSDGKYIIAEYENNTIRIWNLETGRCLRTLNNNTGHITITNFSKLDHINVTNFSQSDIENGQFVSLPSHNIVSPDGKYIVNISVNAANICNIETKQHIHTLGTIIVGHSNQLSTISAPIRKESFSPDSKYFVTGYRDGTVKVLEIATGQIRTLESQYTKLSEDENSKHLISSVFFCPDGQHLLIESRKEDSSTLNTVTVSKIWNFKNEEMYTLDRKNSRTSSKAFSPRGKYLISDQMLFHFPRPIWSNTVEIWDIDSRKKLNQYVSKPISLEQLSLLMFAYANRNNKSFKCPPFLKEELETLPTNIREMLNLESAHQENSKEQIFITNPEGTKRRRINVD